MYCGCPEGALSLYLRDIARTERHYADLSFPVYLRWFAEPGLTPEEIAGDAQCCVDYLRRELSHIDDCIYLDVTNSHKPEGTEDAIGEVYQAVCRWIGKDISHD